MFDAIAAIKSGVIVAILSTLFMLFLSIEPFRLLLAAHRRRENVRLGLSWIGASGSRHSAANLRTCVAPFLLWSGQGHCEGPCNKNPVLLRPPFHPSSSRRIWIA